MTATETALDIARTAARAAGDKLGTDIIGLDVSDRLALTDVFVIISATTERQVNAVVDGIEEELLKRQLHPVRREGKTEGRWVLLDYADVIVHVQHTEDRIFYALERLWGECPHVDLQLEESTASASDS